MILIEKTYVSNIVSAIRAMRYPDELGGKNSSKLEMSSEKGRSREMYALTSSDLRAAKRLITSDGGCNGKFLRMISVTIDLTAPLYFLRQLDNYKIGTVTVTESLERRLYEFPITIDDFSFDFLPEVPDPDPPLDLLRLVMSLEDKRLEWLSTGDYAYYRLLLQMLPLGWKQKRSWATNYEVLRRIYRERSHSEMIEWQEFCNWIETLPHARDLILYEGGYED